jgi:hypothetical protein
MGRRAGLCPRAAEGAAGAGPCPRRRLGAVSRAAGPCPRLGEGAAGARQGLRRQLCAQKGGGAGRALGSARAPQQSERLLHPLRFGTRWEGVCGAVLDALALPRLQPLAAAR